MIWSEELTRIRRFLRDPDGNIWGEELLRKLWRETAVDLQRQVNVLEDMRALSVPPRFEWAYVHDWEYGFTDNSESAYPALHQQGGHYTFTGIWEAQEFANWDADVSDEGAQNTHPWEAWFETPGKPIIFPFPHDFRAVRRMYYDREPLPFMPKKQISLIDPTWQTRSGEPQAYYREDEVSNHFSVWPRPSTASWIDDDGTGMVTGYEDEPDETGSITPVRNSSGTYFAVSATVLDSDGNEFEVSTSSVLDSGGSNGLLLNQTGLITYAEDLGTLEDEGVTLDVVDVDDAILLVMEIDPREPQSLGDDLDMPSYLVRYVRFGVLGRAYAANTDGRIESLSRYWMARYNRGIENIQRFKGRRTADRVYRMVTQRAPIVGTKPKHPRLPDGYPAVNP